MPPNAAPPAAIPPSSPVPGAAPAIIPPPSVVPPAVVTTMPGAKLPSATENSGASNSGTSNSGTPANPATPGLSATGHPLPPPTPGPPAPSWQPAHTAHIQVLDKVNGQAETLTIAVGASGQYRTLSVSVRACDTRPPDQPPDATALIIARRQGTATPIYAGWLLAAEPTAAMVSDPVYDLRVTACT